MSHSLADILGKQNYDEPPEIGIIKSFIKDSYDSSSQVAVQQSQIIIIVSNAALAGTLRMHLHELKRLCQTKKRLVIRIGQ